MFSKQWIRNIYEYIPRKEMPYENQYLPFDSVDVSQYTRVSPNDTHQLLVSVQIRCFVPSSFTMLRRLMHAI